MKRILNIILIIIICLSFMTIESNAVLEPIRKITLKINNLPDNNIIIY